MIKERLEQRVAIQKKEKAHELIYLQVLDLLEEYCEHKIGVVFDNKQISYEATSPIIFGDDKKEYQVRQAILGEGASDVEAVGFVLQYRTIESQIGSGFGGIPSSWNVLFRATSPEAIRNASGEIASSDELAECSGYIAKMLTAFSEKKQGEQSL